MGVSDTSFWVRLQASYLRRASILGLPLGEAFMLSQIWKNNKKMKTKYDKGLMERVAKYCPQNLATFDIGVLSKIFS